MIHFLQQTTNGSCYLPDFPGRAKQELHQGRRSEDLKTSVSLIRIPAHCGTLAWPKKHGRCRPSRPAAMDTPPPFGPLSILPRTGRSVNESRFCVWMSSLGKDVPQLHIVFHVHTRTQTWTTHPDALAQTHRVSHKCGGDQKTALFEERG